MDDSEFKERVGKTKTNQDYEQRMEDNPMD